MKSNNFIIVLKGFIIGSSMSVPGISGGTLAILLGIYDRLISSVSDFFKDVKGNFLFLLKVCVGGGLGLVSLARVISWLLDTFPLPVSFFFLGAVIGGIPALYKKTKESPLRLSSFLYFILGLVIIIAIGFFPTGNVDISVGSGFVYIIMLLITGIVIAIALVLPGISTSHMLLILGMYDSMLLAIVHFDILYISTLCFSTLIGIILITKPIEWTMKKFPHQTYCMIIGFVLGSTVEIFNDTIIPAIPSTTNTLLLISSIIVSIVTFILGAKGILSLSKFSND